MNTLGSRLTQLNNKTNIIRVDIIMTLQMLTIPFLNNSLAMYQPTSK